MASERDLITCLDTNHKLMSEKEELESNIATLEQEVKEKQSKIRDVNESIARNRETLLAQCSSDTWGKPRAPAAPTPSSTRTLAASSAGAATRGHRRGPRRPTARKAKSGAALEQEPQPTPKILNNAKVLPILTAEAPTFVEFEEGWAEVSCHLCGANAFRNLDLYFDGIADLLSHYIIVHHEADVTNLDVINKCKRRYLDASEVRAIKRGTAQVEKRFAALGALGPSVNCDAPEDQAATADNDSDVVEIDLPVLNREEQEHDADSMAAARPSSIITPERATSLNFQDGSVKHASSESASSPYSMDLLKSDTPRARSASPLVQIKRGLILPTVRQSDPRRGKRPHRKRKYSLVGDDLKPSALPKEASRVKNKFNKLAHHSPEYGDSLVDDSSADKDNTIVRVK